MFEIGWRTLGRRNFKRDYAASYAIAPSLLSQVGLGFLGFALVVFPFIVPSYLVFLASLVAITVVAAVGLHILQGLTGIISVGHGAFMATGAYTAVLAARNFGWPMWLTLVLGAIVAAGVGLFFGWPALRLRGLYVIMVTLAASFLVGQVLSRGSDITGGPAGLPVPPLTFPWGPAGGMEMYFVAVIVAAGSVFLAINLTRTGAGRAMQAIRDRDIAAQVLGVPVVRYKLIAFALSSAFAGLAGGLMAINAGYMNPDMFGLELSIQYLAIIIVGGSGSVAGVVFGSMFMIAVPEGLQSLVSALNSTYPVLASRSGFLRLIVFGLLIVIFTIGAPRGLVGLWNDVKIYFRQWPFTY